MIRYRAVECEMRAAWQQYNKDVPGTHSAFDFVAGYNAAKAKMLEWVQKELCPMKVKITQVGVLEKCECVFSGNEATGFVEFENGARWPANLFLFKAPILGTWVEVPQEFKHKYQQIIGGS